MSTAPTLDLNKFRAYTGGRPTDDGMLTDCWNEASEMIMHYIGDATVPVATLTRAVTEVGAELWNRRNAKGGITQFADGSANPIRLARDPMVAAYGILTPFVGMGIG